jgi:HSP20 family protein
MTSCSGVARASSSADNTRTIRSRSVVELRGNDLCISGERKSESEQRQRQYYRSERSYGSFFRSIPLPEGAKPDTASATFENGVLKIEMEATDDGGAQARRIEVREGSPH